MTQQDLAETAGVSAGTVSRLMLTGRAKYTTIDKVARALDVDPQELIKRA